MTGLIILTCIISTYFDIFLTIKFKISKRLVVYNVLAPKKLTYLKIVGTMVHQLIQGIPAEIMERKGLGDYYSDHDHAVYPLSAAGNPLTAAYIQSKGDPIADLHEDLAAEHKARATYENLILIADDPDIIEPLKFLRVREIIHFQRFGEALRIVQDRLAQKPFYVKKPDFMNKNN